MAEWLGNGLQNRVQRFESARDLQKPQSKDWGFFMHKKTSDCSEVPSLIYENTTEKSVMSLLFCSLNF